MNSDNIVEIFQKKAAIKKNMLFLDYDSRIDHELVTTVHLALILNGCHFRTHMIFSGLHQTVRVYLITLSLD